MSNVEPHPEYEVLDAGMPCTDVEVLSSRLVPLGGPRAMKVHRTLPQRERSLVGAWCFVDHYGPNDVSSRGDSEAASTEKADSTAERGMTVPRHPHTGLATVSWIFSGAIDHLDSGGNAAQVRPGELNLMIAGRGITHSEISTPETTVLHGVQLWYAMPEETRFGENHFEHYVPEAVEGAGFSARVFIGDLVGSRSPVETRTPELLGSEIVIEPGATVSLSVRHDFEHAVLAESGLVTVNGTMAEHRALAYVPPGSDTLEMTAGPEGVRVILLGGIPLGEQIVMWWNFVGRTHEEIVEFRRRYQAEMGFEAADPLDAGKRPLFGEFPPGQRAPLPAPVMPVTRLKPRG